MQINTFEPKQYWRSCDLWALSEVLFLLTGQWPKPGGEPPDGLPTILISNPGSPIPPPHIVIEYAPPGVRLSDMVQDAIDAGKLTPVAYGGEARWGRDFEQRFIPREVIDWAASKGCFPDFPYLPGQVQEAENYAATAPKLSADQKADIVRLHAAGESESELARRFGVHRSTVNRALVAAGRKSGRAGSKNR